MKKEKKKVTEAAKKLTASPSLLEGFRKLLAEVHPCLPAYFYGGDGVLVPLPADKEGEDKMAGLGLTRLVPDGHVDRDVLWAIYELFAEADDDWWRPTFPQITLNILRRALDNKSSKLSQAIVKAYGQE